MSLISDIKKLRELEQQATPGKWETDENEGGHEIRMGKAIENRGQYPCHQVIEYEHGCFEGDENNPQENAQAVEAEANACLISELRNHAPAMLAVLECFSEKDPEYISRIRDDYETLVSMGIIVEIPGWLDDLLKRHQKAASLMEGKDDVPLTKEQKANLKKCLRIYEEKKL